MGSWVVVVQEVEVRLAQVYCCHPDWHPDRHPDWATLSLAVARELLKKDRFSVLEELVLLHFQGVQAESNQVLLS
jgi:hypothetical protein